MNIHICSGISLAKQLLGIEGTEFYEHKCTFDEIELLVSSDPSHHFEKVISIAVDNRDPHSVAQKIVEQVSDSVTGGSLSNSWYNDVYFTPYNREVESSLRIRLVRNEHDHFSILVLATEKPTDAAFYKAPNRPGYEKEQVRAVFIRGVQQKPLTAETSSRIVSALRAWFEEHGLKPLFTIQKKRSKIAWTTGEDGVQGHDKRPTIVVGVDVITSIESVNAFAAESVLVENVGGPLICEIEYNLTAEPMVSAVEASVSSSCSSFFSFIRPGRKIDWIAYELARRNNAQTKPSVSSIISAAGEHNRLTQTLHSHINNFQSQTRFEKMLDHLRSRYFQEKIQFKNIQESDRQQVYEQLQQPIEVLREHATMMAKHVQESLRSHIVDGEPIALAFSGGKDTTVIADLLLKTFPNSSLHLIHVSAGIVRPETREYASFQAAAIGSRNGRPLKVTFIDAVDLFSQYVLNPCIEDSEILGFPAVCTSCKIMMEATLAQYAQLNSIKTVVWGYTRAQGNQCWPEQIPEFQVEVNNHLYQDSNCVAISPLADWIHTPIDIYLLGSLLGYEPDAIKLESKCLAAGLNPTQINLQTFIPFIKRKLGKLPNKFALKILDSPPELTQADTQFNEMIATLRQSFGCFHETQRM